MHSVEQMAVAALAGAAGAWWWQRGRRLEIEAQNDRLRAAGAVDMEPIVVASEDLVDAVRRSGTRPRCADVVAIRAVP